MVNNEKLKASLEPLTKSIFKIWPEHFPIVKLQEYPEHVRPYVISNSDTVVKVSPKFVECIGLMVKDEHIKALNGKLVGTINSSSIIQDETSTLLSFLGQFYVYNQIYNQNIFDQAYSSFEELFYSNVLRIRDVSRLNNFQCYSNSIELGHGIIIKKSIIPRVVYTKSKNAQSWKYTEDHISDFILERIYERKKIIIDSSVGFKAEQEDSEQGLSKTNTLFDFVVTALRIAKSSAVFRDTDTFSDILTFHPNPQGKSFIRQSSTTIIQGEKCVIEETDVPELKKIFKFLINKYESRFDVAQRRLFLGMGRSNSEDRLLDYMIGLEALYLPDGNQELTFKLALRTSFLLCTKHKERKEIFNFMKGIYDTRSKIVHGSNYNLTKADIDKLEDLLRKSLKLWITDKRNFSKDQLTNILFTP